MPDIFGTISRMPSLEPQWNHGRQANIVSVFSGDWRSRTTGPRGVEGQKRIPRPYGLKSQGGMVAAVACTRHARGMHTAAQQASATPPWVLTGRATPATAT